MISAQHQRKSKPTVAGLLARALTLEDVGNIVFGQLLPSTGAAAGALVVLTDEGDALALLGRSGLLDATLNGFQRVPLDASTLATQVVRTREPIWIGATATASPPPLHGFLDEQLSGHKALAVLPLMEDEHVTGSLTLAFSKERAFEPDERSLLEDLATHCGVALYRAAAFAHERAGHERLEVALRAANMGTWDWDLRTNEVAWSAQLEVIHGLQPGAFGRALDVYFAHVHPEDVEQVRAGIEASLQRGELHIEYRGTRPNGEVHWYEGHGRLLRDTADRAVALRGVCMDITARKRADQALRDSEERFRTLADNIAQFAWMADSTGQIFWHNRRWYEFTGTTPEQMQGSGWTVVHHPDHVERVVTGMRRCWASGEPWEDTFPLRGSNGQYRWFLSRARPIRNAAGDIVRWLGTDTDITERRWAEALVVGERNALELIARSSPSIEVLGSLCTTVEELAGDGLLASILLVDEDRTHLRHGAGPSLPDEYNQAIDGIAIGPGVGSCGTAAFRGEPVIVADVTTDPLWVDFKDLGLKHNLRACWSTPIRSLDGEILGTFAMYYREPRMPTAEHLRLAGLVGHTAAIILERKRADDTRARLAAIVDSSADEITGKTLDGIVTSWNLAATRLYGYTADERVGRSITEIIPPEQLQEHNAMMERVRRGERVPAWDTARLHKDGYPVEISLSLSPILDDAGRVTGVSAIGRDVRERRRLEAERDRLLAAEHAARELAEAAGRRLRLQYELAELLTGVEPDTTLPVLPSICRALGWDWGALWRVDPDAGVLRCAEVCRSAGGLEPFEAASRESCFARGEGLLGRVWESGEPTWVTNLHNEPGFSRAATAKQVGLQSGVVLALQVGREVVGVLSFMSREARPRDSTMLATLIGIGGQIGQFMERRRAEETLRRQAALLELAPMAVAMRDAQRRIIYWNPAAEAVYGWSAREAIGQVGHELMQTRFSGSLAEHEAKLMSAGSWEGELVHRRRDGTEVTVASRWLVLRNERGESQTLEVSTDITERKEAEIERARLYESERAARAAAEAAIEARDDFMAMVSHDLRNPLAAVKGHIQLVRRRAARGEVLSTEQLLGRLDVIEASITALTSQINELQDATRLQAGRRLDLQLARTDLVALARDCVLHHQHTSESHQLRFESDVPELIGVWDAGRLERVLANLLSNAIKYSPDGGEVLVVLARSERWATVSVTDHGLGIPAADLPSLFERYRRASNVASQIAGTGLGLAGARGIVEQHGGTITVQSKEGQGSTFTVSLPLE